MVHLTFCRRICGITLPEQNKLCGMYSTMLYVSVARGGEEGGGDVFIEKCSILVDRHRRTSECYIEVERKEGVGEVGPPLATAPTTTKSTTLLFTLLFQSI